MPRAVTPPTIRCRGRGAPDAIVRCGAPAHLCALESDSKAIAFFCPRCAPAGAVAIPQHLRVREVTVTVVVTFAGVSEADAIAKAEAARTAELALTVAGGRPEIRDVTSSLVVRRPTGAPASQPRPPRQGEG